MLDQVIQVGGKRLTVFGIVDGQVVHAVAVLAQPPRQIAHGGEDGDDFLRVVEDVVGFLAHFHHHEDHVVARFSEPAVLAVELVAQDELECGLAGAVHAATLEEEKSSVQRAHCDRPSKMVQWRFNRF